VAHPSNILFSSIGLAPGARGRVVSSGSRGLEIVERTGTAHETRLRAPAWLLAENVPGSRSCDDYLHDS
jgi:hypothetical protein